MVSQRTIYLFSFRLLFHSSLLFPFFSFIHWKWNWEGNGNGALCHWIIWNENIKCFYLFSDSREIDVIMRLYGQSYKLLVRCMSKHILRNLFCWHMKIQFYCKHTIIIRKTIYISNENKRRTRKRRDIERENWNRYVCLWELSWVSVTKLEICNHSFVRCVQAKWWLQLLMAKVSERASERAWPGSGWIKLPLYENSTIWRDD